MADIQRFFRRDLSGELAPPVRLPNSYLRAEGKWARTGLQEYEDPDGSTHMELRLPEDVFSAETLDSFRMMPVTNNHPSVMLDTTNTSAYQRGHTEAPRQADEWIAGPLTVTDAQTIRDVESGKNQLSVGYSCELDPTQDPALTAKWGAYKFIQRGIRGNHLAIVDAARAGPAARLRLDSSGNVVTEFPQVRPQESASMLTVRIDGQDIPVNDANVTTIQSAIERAHRAASERLDAAVKTEKDLTAKVKAELKIVRDNAISLIARLARIGRKYDAVKARMMPCDECNGTGQVTDSADPEKMAKCDMCDGDGEYRMMMPVSKATGVEEGSADSDDDDMEGEFEEEEMDQDELSVEQETETEAGKAKADRKRADARKARLDERKAFTEKRAASLKRQIDRAVRARATLESTARKFLGTADLTKLDTDGIKRAVVAKLSPKTKLDGMTASAISERFDAVLDLVGSAALSPSDQARAITSPFIVQPRADVREEKEDGSHLSGRERMIWEQERAAASILGDEK